MLIIGRRRKKNLIIFMLLLLFNNVAKQCFLSDFYWNLIENKKVFEYLASSCDMWEVDRFFFSSFLGIYLCLETLRRIKNFVRNDACLKTLNFPRFFETLVKVKSPCFQHNLDSLGCFFKNGVKKICYIFYDYRCSTTGTDQKIEYVSIATSEE